MYETKQSERWKGTFGNMYHANNPNSQVDIANRMAFWDHAVEKMGVPESFLEVGAGQGPNLLAIQNLYKEKFKRSVGLYALEINQLARSRLIATEGIQLVDELSEGLADVVFTMGVLIHVHPENVGYFMKEMYEASKKWIVCCEYFSSVARSKSYHGWDDALWSDDYGALWVDAFPLKVVEYGFLWDRATKLDNLNYWVMEKQG